MKKLVQGELTKDKNDKDPFHKKQPRAIASSGEKKRQKLFGVPIHLVEGLPTGKAWLIAKPEKKGENPQVVQINNLIAQSKATEKIIKRYIKKREKA